MSSLVGGDAVRMHADQLIEGFRGGLHAGKVSHHLASNYRIPIYACGTCSRARGVGEADLANWGAELGNPKIFVSLIEWADRVITE